MCKSNGEDSEFPIRQGKPRGPAACCSVCYKVWLPASLLMSFDDFAKWYHKDAANKRRVGEARRQVTSADDPPPPPSPVERQEVSDSCKLIVAVAKEGFFLPKHQLKQQCSASTPGQLRLGDPFSINGFGTPVKGWMAGDHARPLLQVRVARGRSAKRPSRSP